ncbi:MAG: acylphosphatase [Actinomycetota bacterium]
MPPPESDQLRRAHVLVSGKVQGVFFRQQAQRLARSKGITGWVRNLSDGRVEAVFEGEASAVGEMVSWCHTGSREAAVAHVSVEWGEPQGARGFKIQP